jgi:LPS sulfotransferase NodH
MSKFIIFANARSGSTSLTKLLGESPDVKMCLEPFHPKYSKWNPTERNYSKFIKNAKTMNSALDEIFQKFTAMKVLVYQFPEKIYKQMLSRKEFKIIFLRRKNLAEAAFSSLVGEQTNIWHRKDMDKNKYAKLKPIKISEIKKIASYVEKMNDIYEKYLKENRKGDVMYLFYEELYSETMDKNTGKISDICNFLDIRHPDIKFIEKYMKPSNSKQNLNNIYSRVPNYKEIQEVLNSNLF